ncbi:MAG: hypothetical protein PHW43_11310, partial [Syntrophales bacterium]|nr:hypothetical protein [Syntrophales bacterium]
RLDPEGGTIIVERLLEEGREIVEAKIPVLLTVVKDINQPRSPSLAGIRRAARADIPTWTAADIAPADPSRLGLDGSPTRVVTICSPPPRAGKAEMIQADSVDAAAAVLAGRIFSRKVL